MTLEEEMAVAVLKGDKAAARALADRLCETIKESGHQLPPLTLFPSPNAKDVRVAIYYDIEAAQRLNFEFSNSPEDRDRLNLAVQNWVSQGGVLQLLGVSRIEVYAFPEA